MNTRNIYLVSSIALILSSCGGTNKSNVYDKQRTASDIKISSLDLQKNEIQMRFEYRTYVSKTLESIDCETTLIENEKFNLKLNPNIKFESFATDILTFSNIDPKQLSPLIDSKTIPYTLRCEANYDKGKEYIHADSILHLVPGTKSQYR